MSKQDLSFSFLNLFISLNHILDLSQQNANDISCIAIKVVFLLIQFKTDIRRGD